MRYEERVGSDAYFRQLVDTAFALSQGCDPPDETTRDFVVIPPGGETSQDQFIR
jgi:hypothetical protein